MLNYLCPQALDNQLIKKYQEQIEERAIPQPLLHFKEGLNEERKSVENTTSHDILLQSAIYHIP
jgi:hypothetical protein